MKVKSDRRSVMSFKVKDETRRLVEQLTAHFTTKTGVRHTMTDVIEYCVRDCAEKEKVR